MSFFEPNGPNFEPNEPTLPLDLISLTWSFKFTGEYNALEGFSMLKN